MPQSKAPHRLGQLQAETKRTPSTPDKLMSSSPLHQRDSASVDKGRSDAKTTEIKKSKGNNMASPNYMKPTTCSDARKERVQVTVKSPAPVTTDKGKTCKSTTTSDSRPSSSSPVIKTLKTLARKASLRPRRPSMKKSSATALSPRKNVRRATCSSTLKDSKFPKVLDLSPGDKDVELTSIVKVCPFDYCSLNGHRHRHLHSLKRLPSARRRSLKTQRSVKLKRLSSVRKRSFRKGRRNISSGKIRSSQGSKFSPIIEEVTDDFFVEIYAEPPENDPKYTNCEKRSKQQELDREISKILSSLESMEDDVESSEEETEEVDGTVTLLEIPEIYAQISFGDNLDQTSDISFDDMYADSDISDSEAKEQTLTCFHENHHNWGYQCCGVNLEENRAVSPDDSEESRSNDPTHMDHEVKAAMFGYIKTENCEENDGALDAFLLAPESISMTGHGERGSLDSDYQEEAPGSNAGMKIETSDSCNELGLVAGLLEDNFVNGFSFAQKCTSMTSQDEDVPEKGLILPSEVASLGDNRDCSEHGEEGSIIKVQNSCISIKDEENGIGKTDDSSINGFGRKESELDGLKECELDEINHIIDALNEDIGDCKDEETNINAFKSEISERDDLVESKLATHDKCPENMSSIVVEDEETGNGEDENIVSFASKKSEQDLEETESATDDVGPDSINLSNVVAESANTESGKAEENDISFGCQRSEESELTAYESPDNINLSVVAEDVETGCDKNKDDESGFDSKKAVADSFEESKLATDVEIGGAKDEKKTNICISSKRAEQDLEESGLATDDESPGNINLSSSESETSESSVHEESDLSTDIENPDNYCTISEDRIGNGKLREYSTIEVEFSGSQFEICDVHQNESVSGFQQPRLDIESRRSCDAAEDWSISNAIPESISINLTKKINSEDNQMSENDELEGNDMFFDHDVADNLGSIENGITIPTEKARCSDMPEVCNKQKVRRRRSINRRNILEMEMLRLINPRAPRFLPLKPDPEDENVDLRHQLMDERKSADAWMIDCALQRVVKKLAPARKKKVALLVEAFEAVIPCESTLMSPTSGFGRPIQACS
ncbi:hypothetical protein Cni_G07834 [Canna indica]|uniref:Calmodulin-binding domain-containing protein n=1 Tax=Canna indica TaxID=4628 RepID=A0AAQ3K1U3_9LILI|nr:hypothetical protein Cni_G07834 [Canna indica]